MSQLLLDTSAYSAMGKGHRSILESVRLAESISLSATAVGELLDGFRNGTLRIPNNEQLQMFLSKPRSRFLPVDYETADRYAEIKNYLRKRGTPLPLNDVWIAASAMQHGLKLVTTDRHFFQVPQVLVDFHEPLQ